MNKTQRNQIEKWIDSLNEIKEGVESMQEDEQDKLDNMPENLQESERGEQMQNGIENLEAAASSLEESIDFLMSATE
jgi:vacuolar-type H+-ATPase subunit E/Vma4